MNKLSTLLVCACAAVGAVVGAELADESPTSVVRWICPDEPFSDGIGKMRYYRRTFETREGGYPFEIEKGTVWQATKMDVADGGYEIAIIERVEGGAYVDVQRVRLDRLGTNFEAVPRDEIAYPIGCAE